jgi:hypothetical protein
MDFFGFSLKPERVKIKKGVRPEIPRRFETLIGSG